MSALSRIASGANLDVCERAAREMGCKVYIARRTGELVFGHPTSATRVRVNLRKKSAPRALTAFLNKLSKHLSA